MSKIPQVTLAFWIVKICATTLGETAGDLLSMTLHVGYATSTILLFSVFALALTAQLLAKTFRPALYWTVVLATSAAGTTMSDFMDRTLGLGYAKGSLILVGLLIATLLIWKKAEGSLSVEAISTRRGEAFYWLAILFSNTLGTALGDYLADSSGLGFLGAALLIGGLLGLVVGAHFRTKISSVALFWIAFILTRPFGATFGDLLSKPHDKGGLNFGTGGTSLTLFLLLIALVALAYRTKKTQEAPA